MNKSISKWFSMLLLMMVASITGATAQSLQLADFSIKSGETKDVPINLTVGENTVYGIQTDIVLSEGLTLEEVVAGEIAGENLSIASNVVGSGATRISQLSYTGETITAGNVITLKVTAAEDFTGGTIQLTNTRLTINTTGSEVTVNDLIVTVTKDEPVVINSMQLYGTFPGLSWEVGVEMTNTDSEPAIWSKTFEGVVLEGTTYEYKVSANGTWGEYQIPADDTNQTWTFGTDMYPAGTYNLTFTVDTENHTLSLTADKQAEPVKEVLMTLPCKENYTEGKFLLIEATEEISCNVWLEKVDAQTGARRFFKVAAGSTIMEDGVAMIELPEGYTSGEFTICADKEFTLKSVQLMATEDAAQPEEVIYTIEPEPEATYTVVGGFTDKGGIDNLLFGKQWDPSLTDNDLVKGTDGIYTWTKENVALEAGTTILYKVVKNHAWDESWGFNGNNADYNVTETGLYNVTFKFNPDALLDNGFNLTCELEKQVVPVDIDALKTALQDAINLATALNAKLGDADLTTAIETATAALNSDDATVVIAAGEALKTAATTAASSALSYAVTLAKSLGVDTSDAEAALASGDAEQMAAALQNLMTAAKTPATNAVQTLISLLQQFNQEALSSIMPEMLAVKSAIDNNKPFAELKAAIEALVEKAKPYAPGIVEKIVGYAQEINNETLNQDIAAIQAAGDDFFALLVAAQQLQNDFITVAGEYLAEVKAIPTEGKQGVEDLNTAIGALESALNATTPDLATVAVAVKNLVQAVKAFEEANTDKNYYILGDFWGWEEAPQLMTQSTENENVYTLVSVMTVEAKTYEYKLRQGDNWDGYQLPASGNYNFQFGTEEYPAGEYYTLTFTANVAEHTLDLVVEKVQPVVDPFNYEKIAIDPADRSTVESLQNFTLTFGEQPVTVNSEVKPTLTIANTEDVVATGEIKLNEDGPVSITFAEAVTTPGNYQLNIPDGAILYYGTAIDPLSFTYTIAGAADFTIDPAPGEVASLSTFNVTFNNYMVELGENAKAYLFNEETEAEIEADVYDLGGGTKLYVSLSEEVTTPGDWQLNIEGVNRMDTGDEIELIFDYTIKSTEPDMNYYILGDFWGWDNPKQMEATETEGIYTLVIDATVDAQKYEYKLRQGDNWNGYQLPADNSNYDFVFGTDEYPAGDYTLTFTFNRAEDKLVLDVQKKSDKPELDSYTYSFCQATNGWTTIDADGDGFTWYIYIDNNNPGYDSKPGLMTSASYANNKALTPDNYLVSPKMKLDGKISFYASAQDASYPSEHFGVAVSTASGTDAADFQMITEEMEMTSARELANAPAKGPRRVQGKWYFYEVDLSSFAGAEGYVAIRHYDCTDMFRLNVDGITLETSQLIDPYDPELEIEPGPEPEPEVVVVPEGLVVEEYSSAYTDYEGEEKTGSMNVGFDGTDVYIQGMCSYLSNAWVKGSLEGNTITFAGKQFFGTFANKYDMFLQNSDVVFIYDAEAGTLTSEDIIYTYSGNLYADYYVNLILTKVNEMAVTPATPSISGIQETSYGDIVVFEVPTVDVDGNGLATSKLSYQFFVDDENTPLVFTTEDFTRLTEDMTVIPYGFTESYDFYPTYIYLNMPHDTWTRIGIQSIYTGGGEENKSEIFWFEMPAGPVEAPDGLTTETYIFKANALEYNQNGDIEHPDYTLQVQVGFDGDDAYIQGLAADMQELWVKATKNEQGQYVIPANQYMGDLSFYGYTFPYYWTAVDAEGNLVDAVLDFDAETCTFTTEQTLALNGAANALDYYLLFNDVIITKFVEVAATPANPTFEDFILSEEVGYTKIYASIPTVGTEGEALNTSKLFYIVWIEKDGVEQPYTFTADLYDQDFEEDVTEVPYSHDGYDIYKGGEIIYLEDAIEELATWTKVGIQSVYYGCDERNVSNIVWSDGTTTGIENLNSVKGDLSGAWYNLNGVRITKPTQKGLYIHNGKKVVIK